MSYLRYGSCGKLNKQFAELKALKKSLISMTSPSSLRIFHSDLIVCTPIVYPPFTIPNGLHSIKAATIYLTNLLDVSFVNHAMQCNFHPIGRTRFSVCSSMEQMTSSCWMNYHMHRQIHHWSLYLEMVMTRLHKPFVLPSTSCLLNLGVICWGPPP